MKYESIKFAFMTTKIIGLSALLQLIVLTTVTVWGTCALAGGADGGGGYQIKGLDGNYVLLDLYIANPKFADTYNNKPVVYGKRSKYFTKTMNYDLYNSEDLPARELALKHLKKWRSMSTKFVTLLENMVTQTRWRFVNRDLPDVRNNNYDLPWSMFYLSPTPTVLFTQHLGPLVCVSCWNRLGDLSQAALLIHEGLRHVQVIKGIEMSSKVIQDLTAKIIFSSPKANESLEKPEILGETFYNFLNPAKDLGMNFMLDYQVGGYFNLIEFIYLNFSMNYDQFGDDLYRIYPPGQKEHNEQLVREANRYVNEVLNHFAN